MTSEEKQKIESEQLIDELSKMPAKVIATAYLHAINYTTYGEDVTEKWVTATQNARALEKAYKKGYYDALNGAQKKQPCENVTYICDGKKCPECSTQCRHTTDISHAKNFKPVMSIDGETILGYEEVEE